MTEHTVTDRGHYEEIILTGWGQTDSMDAVHGIYRGDELGFAVLEPTNRTRGGDYVAGSPLWNEDDEHNFRSDVRALVQSFEERPHTLMYDPGRDCQTSEEVY